MGEGGEEDEAGGSPVLGQDPLARVARVAGVRVGRRVRVRVRGLRVGQEAAAGNIFVVGLAGRGGLAVGLFSPDKRTLLLID